MSDPTIERINRIQTALRNANLPVWARWTIRDLDWVRTEYVEARNALSAARAATRSVEPLADEDVPEPTP